LNGNHVPRQIFFIADTRVEPALNNIDQSVIDRQIHAYKRISLQKAAKHLPQHQIRRRRRGVDPQFACGLFGVRPTESKAASTAPIAGSKFFSRAAPASVKAKLRVLRWNSRAPTLCSSSFRRSLTLDTDTPSIVAAGRIPPWRAIARKTSSSVNDRRRVRIVGQPVRQ
jgi:hypothetical protein